MISPTRQKNTIIALTASLLTLGLASPLQAQIKKAEPAKAKIFKATDFKSSLLSLYNLPQVKKHNGRVELKVLGRIDDLSLSIYHLATGFKTKELGDKKEEIASLFQQALNQEHVKIVDDSSNNLLVVIEERGKLPQKLIVSVILSKKVERKDASLNKFVFCSFEETDEKKLLSTLEKMANSLGRQFAIAHARDEVKPKP
jgi:hypothetical protein